VSEGERTSHAKRDKEKGCLRNERGSQLAIAKSAEGSSSGGSSSASRQGRCPWGDQRPLEEGCLARLCRRRFPPPTRPESRTSLRERERWGEKLASRHPNTRGAWTSTRPVSLADKVPAALTLNIPAGGSISTTEERQSKTVLSPKVVTRVVGSKAPCRPSLTSEAVPMDFKMSIGWIPSKFKSSRQTASSRDARDILAPEFPMHREAAIRVPVAPPAATCAAKQQCDFRAVRQRSDKT
jgi:hypothetical protein